MAKTHNVIKRWKADTPAYFKKIVYGGITLGTTCLGIRVGFEQAGMKLPEWLNRWLEIGVGIGIVATVIAKTAVDKPDEEVEQLNKEEQKDG